MPWAEWPPVSSLLTSLAFVHPEDYALPQCKETKLAESTITSKGQTTVPREVRERIGAKPGTRLDWHVLPDGSLVVRAKTRSALDLAGSLKSPNGKVVPVKELGWR